MPRYRYRRHIHAFRLGLAIVFSTLLAKVFHLQHGEWIGMTVFVVLGMLQFQGAITGHCAGGTDNQIEENTVLQIMLVQP
jgi:hypothetical protein